MAYVARHSVHGDSPGKNTGAGCHALLQGIFPTQGQTQISRIAREFFTIWATREALSTHYLLPKHAKQSEFELGPLVRVRSSRSRWRGIGLINSGVIDSFVCHMSVLGHLGLCCCSFYSNYCDLHWGNFGDGQDIIILFPAFPDLALLPACEGTWEARIGEGFLLWRQAEPCCGCALGQAFTYPDRSFCISCLEGPCGLMVWNLSGIRGVASGRTTSVSGDRKWTQTSLTKEGNSLTFEEVWGWPQGWLGTRTQMTVTFSSFLPHPLLCLLPFLFLKMGFLHMGRIGHEQRWC